jgi:hypothetical protein
MIPVPACALTLCTRPHTHGQQTTTPVCTHVRARRCHPPTCTPHPQTPALNPRSARVPTSVHLARSWTPVASTSPMHERVQTTPARTHTPYVGMHGPPPGKCADPFPTPIHACDCALPSVRTRGSNAPACTSMHVRACTLEAATGSQTRTQAHVTCASWRPYLSTTLACSSCSLTSMTSCIGLSGRCAPLSSRMAPMTHGRVQDRRTCTCRRQLMPSVRYTLHVHTTFNSCSTLPHCPRLCAFSSTPCNARLFACLHSPTPYNNETRAASPLYVEDSPPAIDLSRSMASCTEGCLTSIPPRVEPKLWPLLRCLTCPMRPWCSHPHLHAHRIPALCHIPVNPPLPG